MSWSEVFSTLIFIRLDEPSEIVFRDSCMSSSLGHNASVLGSNNMGILPSVGSTFPTQLTKTDCLLGIMTSRLQVLFIAKLTLSV